MVNKHLGIFLYLSTFIISQELVPKCGTADPTKEETQLVNNQIQGWMNSSSRTPDDDPVHILVAWHVISSSTGLGNIPDSQIRDAVEILNLRYNEVFNYYFTLDVITRHENDDWFLFEPNEQANQSYDEAQMRSSTVTDPEHYYNIWSVLTEAEDGYITLGWNYFPFSSAEDSHWQGTTINYTAWNGGTLEHEAGHYFGLFHTFQGGCSGSNDQVSDTPAMSEDGIYNCDENQDSCPDIDGNDPVTNIMNYSDCNYAFTAGQAERGYSITVNYHPGLLDNEFYLPNLYLDSLSYAGDTDGDGISNPGDTLQMRAYIGNQWGVEADSLSIIFSSFDERLIILDSTVQFEESLSPGFISDGPELDYFEIYIEPNSSLGFAMGNFHITTGHGEYQYEIDIPIEILISLNQPGFPSENIIIKSSPLVFDVDGDSLKEIYVGTDEGSFYGFNSIGEILDGFPYEVGSDIRSSAAIGDLDNDGEKEIVFGSNQGRLFILNQEGGQVNSFYAPGMIWGAPSLADLDNDEDLEIIFTTENSNNGDLYAIHHNGDLVNGFPVDIDEKMMVGPSVGDLEGDGILDIVIVTWDKNIIAVDANGNLKSGFPFLTTKRFNAPATLADLDNNGSLEIIAGNDDGHLHVLNYEGQEMAFFDTGDDIRGGISVADLNDDGSLELIFVGYDDMIHVWNPFTNEELEGWPVDMGDNSLSGPVLADLDNDGDLEIVTAMKSGTVFVMEHNGTFFPNFPMNIMGIESTPAIDDLDNDGDYELIFGTTQGLQVIDIKSDKGNHGSWRLHRGNTFRNGLYSSSLLSVFNLSDVGPAKFLVSSNYPNPFNPITSIDIQTSILSRLDIKIYDVSGRVVNTIINEIKAPNIYSFKWNGDDQNGSAVSTGIYFIQVMSGKESHTQKMALIK